MKELKREIREGPEKEHQGQDDENKGTEDATLCPTVGREERDVWIWGERYRDEIQRLSGLTMFHTSTKPKNI